MRNSREAIYNALLALIQEILGGMNPPLKTVSRVWRPHTDYAVPQLPAAVLDEKKENASAKDWGAPPLYHLYVDLWLYFAAPAPSQIPGQETTIPMTIVNNAIDALEATPLANPPGMPAQTLGGLVQRVYIEGDILKAVATGSSQQNYSLARVPLVIFTT